MNPGPPQSGHVCAGPQPESPVLFSGRPLVLDREVQDAMARAHERLEPFGLERASLVREDPACDPEVDRAHDLGAGPREVEEGAAPQVHLELGDVDLGRETELVEVHLERSELTACRRLAPRGVTGPGATRSAAG